MKEPASLVELQRAFARSITSVERLAAARPSAVIDASVELPSLLRSDRGIAAGERLSVYRNAYFERILEVLRDDFAALHAVMGAESFRELARHYLAAHPSRHYSLRCVGERLASFLGEPALAAVRRRWPHAAELAALEWAMVEVFDAADARLLTRAALAATPAERWAGLRPGLVRAQRVLSLQWPVQRLWQAWSGGASLPPVEASPTRVLVYRCRESVFCRAISGLEADALGLLGEGHDLGTICGAVAEQVGMTEAPQRIRELLERWTSDELLVAP